MEFSDIGIGFTSNEQPQSTKLKETTPLFRDTSSTATTPIISPTATTPITPAPVAPAPAPEPEMTDIIGNQLKVGLILAHPFIFKEKVTAQSGISAFVYSGMLYEIWSRIKYLTGIEEADVTEIPLEGVSYAQAIDKVNKGELDGVIGDIVISESNIEKVVFARTLFISQLRLAYKPKLSMSQVYFHIFKRAVILPIVITAIIAVILGVIRYYFDKSQTRTQTIWQTFGQFLGVGGGMWGDVKIFNVTNVSLALIITLLSFYYIIFLQAEITSELVVSNKIYQINESNIKGKKFVVSSKYDLSRIFEKFGMDCKTIDLEPDTVVDYYLRHTNEYDGYLAPYEEMRKDIKVYPEIVIGDTVFGFQEKSFAFNFKQFDMVRRINKAIARLQEASFMKDTCAKYLGKEDSSSCVL
jgi:Bacterial extracellular solute-binding proteins, family 3